MGRLRISGEAARPERYRMSETYTREVISQRTAEVEAEFLLPHLRSGMRMLDCGCGPGSITVGLAELVAPGQVVGIDLRADDLVSARVLASNRGMTNVAFQRADIYRLPFGDGAFDAALAHAVLQHLGDPLRALIEIRRVLRPGGVLGIADRAWQLGVRYPTNPTLDAWDRLWPRTIAHHGGSPFYAPSQRALLLQAGFVRAEGHARVSGAGSATGAAGRLEETRNFAQADLTRLHDVVHDLAVEQGWATEPELAAMAEAIAAWGERPDAFYAMLSCCAIGWT